MPLVLESGYEPGHVEMYYGYDYTLLGTFYPCDPNAPGEGDYKAEFIVNGVWRFNLTKVADKNDYIEFNQPHEITPEIEKIIKGTSDADSVVYDNEEYTLEWFNNNWFEVFVFQFLKGQWEQVSDGEIAEEDGGPTAERMEALLEESIEQFQLSENDD